MASAFRTRERTKLDAGGWGGRVAFGRVRSASSNWIRQSSDERARRLSSAVQYHLSTISYTPHRLGWLQPPGGAFSFTHLSLAKRYLNTQAETHSLIRLYAAMQLYLLCSQSIAVKAP